MAGKELRFGLLMTVIDRSSAALRGIESGFGRVGQAGRALSQLGADLRIARENVQDFAQRGAQGLRDLIAPTQDVENALLDLRPVVERWGGDTGAILAQVTHDAIEHSRATGQSATEYIAAYTKMAQANHDQAGAERAAHLALQMASGTRQNASDAATTLALTYEQLGDHTRSWEEETLRLSDQLVRARQLYSSFDVTTMRDVAKDAATTARDAGVPTHQLIGLVGALQQAGVAGGESAASAQGIIAGLESASTQVGFALERTVDGGLDLQRTLLGIREQYGSLNQMTPETRAAFQEALGPAWKHTALLIDQADRLNQQWSELRMPLGTAAAAHRDATSTSAAELAKLNAEWTAVKLELGQGVLPAIRELVPQFRELLAPIMDLVRTNPELVASFGTWSVLTVLAANVASPVLSAASAAASLGGQALSAAGKLGDLSKSLRGPEGHIAKFTSGASRAGSAAASAGRTALGWGSSAVRGAGQFVAATGRMSAALFTRLFPATSGQIAHIARLTAAKATYAGRSTAAFVAATGRSAMALAGRLGTATASAAGSVWRLIAAKGAYAGRGAAAFVGAVGRSAAALMGPFVRGADRFIAATLRMGLAAGKLALTLMANPITWIVLAIVAAAALIYIYWDPITAFFGKVWESIKATWAGVTSFFAGIWNDVKAAFDQGFVQGILKVIEMFSPVAWIAKGFDAVTEYLFGFSLFDAGKNIVTTVWEGIKSMASKPVEAMRDMAGKIRNLLPFSPAKDGPLRDLHRVRLVETLADTVNPSPLVDAMTGVASQAIQALTAQAFPVPQFAAMPAGVGFGGAAAGGMSAPVHVTFQLTGNNGPEVIGQIEAWIRDPSNARKVVQASQSFQARQQRAEF